MRCYFRGCIGLLLLALNLQASAGEYGHYHLERLVAIDKAQAVARLILPISTRGWPISLRILWPYHPV